MANDDLLERDGATLLATVDRGDDNLFSPAFCLGRDAAGLVGNCDVTVAAENARFSFPEILVVAVIGGG